MNKTIYFIRRNLLVGCLLLAAAIDAQPLIPVENLKLDILQKMSEGSAEVTSNTNFDIGSLSNIFDGNTKTLARTPAVNPLILTIQLKNNSDLISSRIMCGNTAAWQMEVAMNLNDLENRTGTYQLLVNQAANQVDVYSEATFKRTQVKVIRLTCHRTTGDNYVHLREWELKVAARIAGLEICPGNYRLIPGIKKQYNAYALDIYKNRFLIPSSNTLLTWKSNNPKVGSISSTGLVKTIGVGKMVITANYRTFNATAEVQVTRYFEPEPADKKIVKVALVVEDPTMEEMTWSVRFGWNDPRALADSIVKDFLNVSEGSVQFQLITIEGMPQFTMIDGVLISPDSLYHIYSREGGFEWLRDLADHGRVKYNYNAMIDFYNFCTLRDAGVFDEVWVYSHPFAGTWESTLAGKNAFFYNSPPVQNTSCMKLLPIMGLNYERTHDLALHSFGHRFENSMLQAYGRWDTKNPNPNNWELFTRVAANNDPGFPHIGNIHFPFNGTADYDYENPRYTISYADNWETYPLLTSKTRNMNCSEWGCSQLGYMRWWYRHIPRYKGITEGVLNNWWHYMTDFEGAVALAKSLRGDGCGDGGILLNDAGEKETLRAIQEEPETEPMELEVYPSPANETISIQVNANVDVVKDVHLLNAQGQEVNLKFERTGETQLRADTRALAPGLYIVKITGKGISKDKKIVVFH